jgi:non-ribosomal peptide synthetase component F
MPMDGRQESSVSLDEQEDYWRKQLQAVPITEFPIDYPRSPVQSFIKASECVEFDTHLSSALHRYCAQENVSPFALLLAVWKVLLLRYTGHDDVIVGSLVSDSVREQHEAGRDTFVNLIALRTNLAGDPPVKEVIQRVARTIAEAAKHRHYPFAKLVEAVQGERDFSRAPLFQVMLVWCNLSSCISEAHVSEEDLADIEEHAAQCDLVIVASEQGERIHLRCAYDAELFEAASIRRKLGHFQRLLEGFMGHPDQPISTLSFLTEAERRQLLVEWNDTRADYPSDLCLHQLVEAQAARTPEALAVIWQDTHLTYRELNARANQLGHYLRQRGVGPEVVVGLCLERSLDLVVGLLAILKAGGAYLPLDPPYPRERLAFMLEDAQAPVLVTERRWRQAFSAYRGTVVCLDAERQTLARESAAPVVSEVTAEHLAYVIYTSGSTGRPKGVQIPHRAVVNFLQAIHQ